MADAPWLTIIGLGEDGAEGLSPASRNALAQAEIVIGPARHLSLLPETAAETREWPVPFADGIEMVLAERGRRVAVLASGDPFWFGAGAVLARHLEPGEWCAFPGPSTFSLAANRLGWPLEQTVCLGLHATRLARLRPHLARGARLIVLLRDGDAVDDLADYLRGLGFGPSTLHVMQALGGPREAVSHVTATDPGGGYGHPVCVAVELAGDGGAVPLASGRPDAMFATDGVMTKRPVRALTLSALAPRPGEHLWDIGSGSGSVAVEWMLSHPTCRATAFEPRADRVTLIRQNAEAFGTDRLEIIEGAAPDALRDDLPPPDAVFVGGGLSDALLQRLMLLPPGTRLVANAVTLSSEALLIAAHGTHGGDLMRTTLSHATPLGPTHAWSTAYPITQWSVTL